MRDALVTLAPIFFWHGKGENVNSINAYRENKLYKKGKGDEKFFWHGKVKILNVING